MTRFVVLDPENVFTFSNVGAIEAIDISGFAGTDFISVALADYPGNSIDPAHTFIDFTSNDLGDLDAGPTDSIAFSNSTLALVAGDCELRFPISLLTQIDKTQITGVRFHITATQQCTFRALAIRAVAATWVYAPTDVNTLYDRVVRPVSPNASLAKLSDFPTATGPITPVEFPIVFRADDPPGANDPQPIDASVSVAFNTGAMLAASGDNDTGVVLSGAANTGVTVPDDPTLRFTTQFTAEAHIQPTNVVGNKVIVAKERASAGGQRCYSFELQGSELQLRVSSNGTALTTVTTTGANIGTSTKQIVGVSYQQNAAGVSLPLLFSSTIATTAKVTFFINGEPFQAFTTSTEPINAGTDPFTIGFN